MKKIITAAIAVSVALPAVAVPTLANAQSYGEVRHDQRDLREEKQDLREAKRGGDPRQIRDERKDVHEARQELREDWRDYKNKNRNAFHRPAYVGPRGYRYRPVTVGYRFAPEYLRSRYWITSYNTYRLPAPRPGTRWIRYGDDVVLVNIRSGKAITVYTNFFD